jgi:hypothetical protein
LKYPLKFAAVYSALCVTANNSLVENTIPKSNGQDGHAVLTIGWMAQLNA